MREKGKEMGRMKREEEAIEERRGKRQGNGEREEEGSEIEREAKRK